MLRLIAKLYWRSVCDIKTPNHDKWLQQTCVRLVLTEQNAFEIIIKESCFDLKEIVGVTAIRTFYLCRLLLQAFVTRWIDFKPGDYFVA
jgi:hypothetical protein